MALEFYMRPNGWHYHCSKACPMLDRGQFEAYHYRVIDIKDPKATKDLKACWCVYNALDIERPAHPLSPKEVMQLLEKTGKDTKIGSKDNKGNKG